MEHNNYCISFFNSEEDTVFSGNSRPQNRFNMISTDQKPGSGTSGNN